MNKLGIEYRVIKDEEIDSKLFKNFNRHQEVKKCYRKEKGEWILKDISFTEEWDEDDFEDIVLKLKMTISKNGVVIGAFKEDRLVGFVSVENELLGMDKNYIQLSEIHVTEELRGKGIGKGLFKKACMEAASRNGKKLYISAHSSKETQEFYRGLGCRDAEEVNKNLQDLEPCDCQMEFVLDKKISN